MDIIKYKNFPESKDVITLFSGAMGLDIGLEIAGLKVKIPQDFDKDCIAAMRANNHKVLGGDIRDIEPHDLLSQVNLSPGEPFLICGGPHANPFRRRARG